MTLEHAPRVAMLSVHTSPLDQPGTGDAGGMNVYVLELARALAARGARVEIFTRATSSDQPETVLLPGADALGRPIVGDAARTVLLADEVGPGVTPPILVHHVPAGPFERLDKNDLPGVLCGMAAGVLRWEAARRPGWYDVVHSHYWLSGQVGQIAADRWEVPLVHTAHTLARVKNASLAPGDTAEPTAARGRRGAAGRRGRRPGGQHPGRGRGAGRALRRRPRARARRRARRGPGPLRAGRPAGGATLARSAHRPPDRALRRPRAGAEGARTCWSARSACCGRRAGRSRCSSCSAVRRDGPAPSRSSRRSRRWRASPTTSSCTRRRTATPSRAGTTRPTWSRCRRAASRSGSSPPRPRPAGSR